LSATLKNKHLAGAPVAGITLAIALLAAMLVLLVFPGWAEAQEQEEAPNNAQTTTTVQPGESLWTMAQAQLAPDTPPQRVALEAERIYALNQDRIGPDPALILAGQELLVPPVTEPATGEVVATQSASPQPAPPEPTTVRPEEIPASAATWVEEAPAPATELPVLPEAETNFTVREIVPQVSTIISPFSDLGDTERRRVLGVGIIFLTLVLALIMAWRLPLSRTVGGSSSSWGSYGGGYGAGRAYDDDYSRNYALSEQPAKDLSESEGTSVGQESASPEEPFEETPQSSDESVASASVTAGSREAEHAPTGGVSQRDRLRLVEETPTEEQEQHQPQRHAGGGR
jgi:hypothetical protein